MRDDVAGAGAGLMGAVFAVIALGAPPTVVLGTVIGLATRALVRERRRRVAAASGRRVAARIMRDGLWAFKTGLDIAIDHKSTALIDDPKALEEAWREHRAALESLPPADQDVIQLAVTNAVMAGAARSSEGDPHALEDTVPGVRATVIAAAEVLQMHLE